MTQKLSKNAKKVWRTRTTFIFLLFAFFDGGLNFFFSVVPIYIALGGTVVYLFTMFVAIPYVYM